MCNLANEQHLKIVNNTSRCLGKWTHVIRTTGEKSRLDYVLVDSKCDEKIESMVIDEATLLTPFRVVNKKECIFSDHNSIVVNITAESKTNKVNNLNGTTENRRTWKLSEEGIDQLPQVCEELMKNFSPEGSTQECYDKFDEMTDIAMDSSFKRRLNKMNKQHKKDDVASKISKQYAEKYRYIIEFAKKGKAQRLVAKLHQQELLNLSLEDVAKMRAERIRSVIKEMTIDGEFDSQKFCKLRRSHSANEQSCTSIITNGTEVFAPEQIERAFKDEFEKRLERPEIPNDSSWLLEKTNSILTLLIQETSKSEPFTNRELDDVLKELKKGKSCGQDGKPPELFLNGSNNFKKAVLDILNKIKESAFIPDQWNDVNITTLYKLKGSRKELVNQRGIFLTIIAYKIFEKLIKKRSEETMEKINLLQAGGRKHRGPSDQTFILRSLINHAIYVGKPIIVTCYDYKQCFDKIWLQEAILALWRLGLPEEYAKLIYKLNETSLVSVKTPFGCTERFMSKDVTKQGTVLGPALCSASLGEVLDELEGGASIGDMNIPALLFVDDLNSTQTDIRRVHSSHNTVVHFSQKKNQPLNKGKCCVLPVNKKPGGVCPVLKIDDHQLEEVVKVGYVGDFFNTKGNNNDLIQDRVNKGTQCTRRCFAECGDITLGVHTIEVLLFLYNVVFVHTVLFNSGAWCNLTQNNKDKLTEVQMKYLRRIMHVPVSTPAAVIFRELGVIPLVNELECRQLYFLHHILSLQENDPVRTMYEREKRYPFAKSWYCEILVICEKYGIEFHEEKIEAMGKLPWKYLVKKKVHNFVVTWINESGKDKTKTKNFLPVTKLHPEKYLISMKPQDARLLFRVRSRMIDLKAVCYYRYQDVTCRLCGDHDETMDHVLNRCKYTIHEHIITMDNVYQSDDNTNQEIVERIQSFLKKVSEKDDEKSQQDSVSKEENDGDVICIPVH